MAKITKFWRRKKFADYRSGYELAYDREIMSSEWKRSLIIFVFGCATVAWGLSAQRFLAGDFPDVLMRRHYGFNFFSWLAIVFGCLAGYELFYSAMLLHFLRRGRMFPFFPRYLNAFSLAEK